MKLRLSSALYFGIWGLVLSALVFKPFGGERLYGPSASGIRAGMAIAVFSALLSGLILGFLFAPGFRGGAEGPTYRSGMWAGLGITVLSCPLTGFFAGLATGLVQVVHYHSATADRVLPEAFAFAFLSLGFILFVFPAVMVLSLLWTRLLKRPSPPRAGLAS